MINEIYAWAYCCEDIRLIENYEKAINDDTRTWHCHHRLETDLGLSRKELIALNKYFHIEAKDLIFLTRTEHTKIHKYGNKNKLGQHCSDSTKEKLSITQKDKPKRKYKWMTPSGEIVEMYKSSVSKYHPDWKIIDNGH